MSLAVCHGPSNDQSRPFLAQHKAIGREFLIRRGEDQRSGDNVPSSRAQAERIICPSIAKKLIEPVCEGVCGVRALARHTIRRARCQD